MAYSTPPPEILLGLACIVTLIASANGRPLIARYRDGVEYKRPRPRGVAAMPPSHHWSPTKFFDSKP